MPKYKLRMNSEIYMKKSFLLEGKKFRENLLIKSTIIKSIIIYFSRNLKFINLVHVSHQRKISLFIFAFTHTHTHTHTIFLSNYSLSFLLYFATLIKVSQILLDLCFLQKSLSNKSQTLLSLSLHYLPSDFFFFSFPLDFTLNFTSFLLPHWEDCLG